MNELESMGIFGVFLGILLFVWSVLMFFAPFFWYGAWFRAKEMDKKLEETNRLLHTLVSK